MIALGVEALKAVGLPRPTIDLGHLGLARELLGALNLSETALEGVRRAVAKRDSAGLDAALRSVRGALPCRRAGAPPARALRLARCPGGRPPGKPAPTAGVKRALSELSAIVAAVEARGRRGPAARRFSARCAASITTRACASRRSFPGAPDAVLRGGRYDDLLARYGRPSPAVGFAVDVEAVAVALESDDAHPVPKTRPTRSKD